MQSFNLHQNTRKDETFDPNLSTIGLDYGVDADFSLLPNYSNPNKLSKSIPSQINSSNPTNQDESIIELSKEDEVIQNRLIGESKKQHVEKRSEESMKKDKNPLIYDSSSQPNIKKESSAALLNVHNMRDHSSVNETEKGLANVKIEKISKEDSDPKAINPNLTTKSILITDSKTAEDESKDNTNNLRRRKQVVIATSLGDEPAKENPRKSTQPQEEQFRNSKRSASVFINRKASHKEKKYGWFIIPHRSRFKMAWDSIFQIVLIAVCTILPVEIAFFEDDGLIPNGSPILVIVILSSYWIDIILKMRTTYVTADFVEVTNSKKIALDYIKSWKFFFDLLSSIPVFVIGYIYSHIQGNSLRTLTVNLLIRVFELDFTKLEIILPLSLKRAWRLIITITRFILIIHWITCLWYLVVSQLQIGESDEIQSWIPATFRAMGVDSPIEEYLGQGNIMFKYSYAAYNILMLMTGNDITPTSTFQAFLCIGISIIGNMGLGFIFGSISFLIQKMNHDRTMYQEKLETLQRNLIQNEVPTQLRNRVYDYFDVYWQKKNQFIRFSDFSELSEPLQRELAFHIHQDLIKTVPLFRELESIEIFSIIKKLQSSVYLPGDRIIREGDYGQEMFFISEGGVEVVIKKATDIVPKTTVTLKKGDHFGEIALISNSRRTSDVNCIDFCVLEKYSKQDYLYLQEEFPDIKVRLRKGLKLFKEIQSTKIATTLKNIALFGSFSIDTIQELVRDYLEEKFLDPLDIILKPKKRANALYLILMGTVKEVSPEGEDIGSIIQKTRRASAFNIPSSDPVNFKRGLESVEEYASNLHCLDDEVERGAGLGFDPQDQLEGKVLQSGDYFGGLVFDGQQPKPSRNYYIAESGCQVLMLPQRAIELIKEKSPKLFQELRTKTKERLSFSDPVETETPGKISLQIPKELKSEIQSPIITSSQKQFLIGSQSNELESVTVTVQQIEKMMQSLKKQLGME